MNYFTNTPVGGPRAGPVPEAVQALNQGNRAEGIAALV